MKIFSASQIRKWDEYSISHEPIESIDLMERAAGSCYHWLLNRYGHRKHFLIFCGTGNNGGDGLAIARLLAKTGIGVVVYLVGEIKNASADCTVNLQRLQEMKVPITFIQSNETLPAISKEDVIIDAVFGTGLNRPAEGIAALLIQCINQSRAGIVSIDIPSGLFADRSSKGNVIIEAVHTLSFQCYKLAFLLAENAEYVGQLDILDIGLHEDFLQSEATNYSLTASGEIKKIYRPRKLYSHKGNFGHALLIGGSTGKMGAMILAARGCLRSGVGLLTVSIPASENNIMQIAVPEAMTSGETFTNEYLQKFSTLGLGPGWGTSTKTQELLHTILLNYKKTVVLDADALNCLSLNKSWLTLLPAGAIITPHPKEFERLFGTANDEFDQLETARKNAAFYKIVIVLKGHYTAIACPDGNIHFNSTGNPGMAKGGSGDTLTGILTGLLAQGYAPVEAALFGVYLHGFAGDLAASAISQEAMLPDDLIDNLGKAFTSLISNAYDTI